MKHIKNEKTSAKIDEVPAFAGSLLIIFTRNPELGKVKTRLAKTIGDEAALEIYKFLLQHTVSVTRNLGFDVAVHYSEKIHYNDVWDEDIYIKKQQIEGDLGKKMEHAFLSAFKNEYKNVIIIGSDLYDITQEDLEDAFKALETFEYVVGPSEDGGYYLLGMKQFKPELFKNKSWGTDSVLRDTLLDLKEDHIQLLEERNDIDVYEDLKNEPVFQQYLKKTN